MNRQEVFEPLFREAKKQAREQFVPGNIAERINFCLKLLSEQGPVPSQPREIAFILVDFATKLGCFGDFLDNILPWDIRSWDALEILTHDLVIQDVEQGIRCIELTTLYQVRYWSQSSERFHGTPEDKAGYIESLASLLSKLHLLNVNFEQFDNWYI